MAALAESLQISVVGESISVQLVANAADTYYRGACVYIDNAGGCQVTGASGDVIGGICPREQTVAAGDLVEVIVSGCVWLPLTSNLAATDEGLMLHMDVAGLTDNPDDADSTAGNAAAAADVSIGRILRFTAAQTLIRLEPMQAHDGTAWT